MALQNSSFVSKIDSNSGYWMWVRKEEYLYKPIVYKTGAIPVAKGKGFSRVGFVCQDEIFLYVVAKKLISWQVVLFLFLPFHNGTKTFLNFLKPLQNTARSWDMLSRGVRTHLTDTTWFCIGSKDFWYTQILHVFFEIHWFFKDFTCL